MKKTIEFKTTNPDEKQGFTPWIKSAQTTKYKDLVIKPEYATRRFSFPSGDTWFRIVPALKASSKNSFLGVHAIQYKGGRHAHARTLTPEHRSVFDQAYRWFLKHQPEALYSKSNKEEGHRLLADPLLLFWIVTEVQGKPVLRLMLASGYDGLRGGNEGLGHQIWALSKELDEDGKLIGDPTDPELGVQICVTKTQAPGSKYATYRLKRGRIPAPVDQILAGMDKEELDLLTPLENVVRILTEEEEWQALEQVIDSETVRKIRESIE
jgi:hypothetical protein